MLFCEIVALVCCFVFYVSKIFEFKDSNNFESDPKEFARLFCKDTGIEDPEVGVSVSNYHW